MRLVVEKWIQASTCTINVQVVMQNVRMHFSTFRVRLEVRDTILKCGVHLFCREKLYYFHDFMLGKTKRSRMHHSQHKVCQKGYALFQAYFVDCMNTWFILVSKLLKNNFLTSEFITKAAIMQAGESVTVKLFLQCSSQFCVRLWFCLSILMAPEELTCKWLELTQQGVK